MRRRIIRTLAQSAVILSLCVGGLGSVQAILAGKTENSSDELMTTDQYFVIFLWRVATDVYTYAFSDYNVCCVIFPEKMSAAKVVIDHFNAQSIGNINDYGLTLGETSDTIIVDVSPRYDPCTPSSHKDCEEDGVPYVAKPLAAYVYILEKDSLQIREFNKQI